MPGTFRIRAWVEEGDEPSTESEFEAPNLCLPPNEVIINDLGVGVCVTPQGDEIEESESEETVVEEIVEEVSSETEEITVVEESESEEVVVDVIVEESEEEVVEPDSNSINAETVTDMNTDNMTSRQSVQASKEDPMSSAIIGVSVMLSLCVVAIIGAAVYYYRS